MNYEIRFKKFFLVKKFVRTRLRVFVIIDNYCESRKTGLVEYFGLIIAFAIDLKSFQ